MTFLGNVDLLPENEWTQYASCLEPSISDLYLKVGKGNMPRSVKRACGGCAVRQECLQYAILDDSAIGNARAVRGGLGGDKQNKLISLLKRGEEAKILKEKERYEKMMEMYANIPASLDDEVEAEDSDDEEAI